MKENRIYSVMLSCIVGCAVGPVLTTVLQGLRIDSNNRQFKIKSLTYDLRLNVSASGIPIDVNNQDIISLRLILGGAFPITQMHKSLTATAPAPGIVANGVSIDIVKPGQYLFDSWFIQSAMDITVEAINSDPINDIRTFTTLIFETEEL